jgi:hypothetical protein
LSSGLYDSSVVKPFFKITQKNRQMVGELGAASDKWEAASDKLQAASDNLQASGGKLHAEACRRATRPKGYCLPLAACRLPLAACSSYLALVGKSPYFTRLIKTDFQHYN